MSILSTDQIGNIIIFIRTDTCDLRVPVLTMEKNVVVGVEEWSVHV